MEKFKELTDKIEALEAQATELLQKAEDEPNELESVKALINDDIVPQVQVLTNERDELLREEEFKSLKGQVTTLGEALEELRKPAGGFALAEVEGKSVTASNDELYGSGEHSFFQDIKLANKGRGEAIERLGGPEGKAMTEGVGAQGGYLVQKQVERAIVETKELDNVLRSLCSKLNVRTNEIELNQITVGTTAGWVAELAAKPESTALTLTTVSANVFTAAGLATISNQLLADSNPAVDGLVTSDLAKRLVALEETAFIAGSGTGQPLGILNTPGVSSKTNSVVDPSADGGLLDTILDAIGQVETDHGSPTAILLHPRTWTRILKDKDAAGSYVLGSPTDYRNDYTQPRTTARGPSKSLFGVNVITSNRIPTNLGGTTNESRVVVADFSEALILDRQGITVDESPHVYFTTNQTVFRAEERVGFTAARTPKAFCVIGGAGLAAG